MTKKELNRLVSKHCFSRNESFQILSKSNSVVPVFPMTLNLSIKHSLVSLCLISKMIRNLKTFYTLNCSEEVILENYIFLNFLLISSSGLQELREFEK